VFLAPSDAKVAYTQGSVDAWSTWEPYVSQEEVLFQSRRVITAEGLTPGLGFQVATPNAIRDKRRNWRISCAGSPPPAPGR
jgi:sulfonate transport system substrate-binding protein